MKPLKFARLRSLNGKPYWFRSLVMHINQTIIRINYYLLKTYPLIWECARCEDCGRNVHDFTVPDCLWKAVYGNEGGILCYDCFCNRADELFRVKWRMFLKKRGGI